MPPLNAKKALLASFSNVTLLCIAIAVSLATAAWINGLPTVNMYSEALHIINYQWGPNCAYVDVTLYNNGTQPVLLKSVKVNSQQATGIYIVGSEQIGRGEAVILRVATATIPELTCQIAFQTAKGNMFVYTTAAK